MHIEKIEVYNFRMLKNFSMNLEKELSLVIGKNNVGKTSLLEILKLFLYNQDSNNKFSYNDFNFQFREMLKNSLINPIENDGSDEFSTNFANQYAIRMNIVVKYSDNDNLENIGNTVLMNLDNDNYYFAIGFAYFLSHDSYSKLLSDYNYHKNENGFNIDTYIERNITKYFKIITKTIDINKEGVINELKYKDLSKINEFKINNIIAFEYINAKRKVDNQNESFPQNLSGQTARLYKQLSNEEANSQTIANFEKKLQETDNELNSSYRDVFKDVLDNVQKFGGMRPNDSEIRILSKLKQDTILKNNTIVMNSIALNNESQDNYLLPENYNGLGYMNLISIIFDIEIIINKFKKKNNGQKPADISLLFIEEPEAHTHPQMQYIFIKNIKNLLKNRLNGESGNGQLQYIISSHSSHIVSECDFDDIKYLKKKDGYIETEAKNLKDLKKEYGDSELKHYKFLKQYLTINRCELFFADKVIFIEGDTERILLPTMMKKFDTENVPDAESNESNLCSQNISVIEAGAHVQVFVKFLNFLGLRKVLVFTDFDCCKENGPHKKGIYRAGTNMITSNSVIKYYYGEENKKSDILSNLNVASKTFKWNNSLQKFENAADGNYMICYQTKENSYQPRSFEDDFFALNKHFMQSNTFSSDALAPEANEIDNSANDWPYLFAEKVESKASMAVEILLNGINVDENTNFIDWMIPTYIKEGLTWLRK